MPVSRNYGGFSPSYSSSYYSPTYYTPGSYSTYRSTTSYAPSSSRASTPSRSMISLIPEERKREFRNFGLTPMAAPAAYKYFSRSDFYNSAAIFNRNMASTGYNAQSTRKELKTVKTEDLDVDREMRNKREHAIPGEIKRDTVANIAGGKQVIRLVTTNRKTNPYNVVSQPTEELSMGQRLALKHLLVDPKEKEREEAARAKAEAEAIKAAAAAAEDCSSEAESEWTWETCSESEAEELEEDKPAKKAEPAPVVKPILTTQKSIDKVNNPTPTPYSTPRVTSPYVSSSTYTTTAATTTPNAFEKKAIPTYPTWMRTTGISYVTPTPSPAVTASPATPTSTSTTTYRRSSWLEDRSTVPTTTTTTTTTTLKTEESSSSSSNSVGSPKFLRRYGGAGSRTLLQLDDNEKDNKSDSSSDEGILNIGWRRGQPPRSDVVVKLSHDNAAARVTNKILVQTNKPELTRPLSTVEKKVSFSSGPTASSTSTAPTSPTTLTPIMSKTSSSATMTTPSRSTAFHITEAPKPVVKEVKIPTLKFASESRAPTLLMMETGVLRATGLIASNDAVKCKVSLAVAEKCLVTVALQVTAEDSVPLSVRDTTDSSHSRAIVHADNLVYASRDAKVKLSTCSEVVLNDVEEQVFETPHLLDDLKFSTEEIEAITEQPSLSALVVSTAQCPIVHTLEAVIVKIEDVKVEPKFIRTVVVPPIAEAAVKNVAAVTPVKEVATVKNATAVPPVKEVAAVKQAAAVPHVKEVVAVVSTIKEVAAVKNAAVVPSVVEPVDVNNVTAVPPVIKVAVPDEDVPDVSVKAKKKKTEVVEVVAKQEGKAKKKVNKEKAKQKKDAKDRRANTPPAPSENRLLAPSNGTAMSTSLPSSASTPQIIPDHPEIRKSGSASGPEKWKQEEAIIATQLERVPSLFRKVFELKSRGDDYVPERPKDGPLPKYWNNEPKQDASNAQGFHEMAQMKQEVKKHKEKIKQEQEALLKSSEGEPEEVWYKDESFEFQEQLKAYEHMASDHKKNAQDKKTPEENAHLVRMYGGIQFPGTPLDPTPQQMLRHQEGESGRCPSEAEEDDEAGAFSDTAVSHVAAPTPAGGPGTRQRRRSVPPSTANIYFNEPPVKTRPAFRKYGINDFVFHRVLGKGSFGKVILAELRDGCQSFYAIKCLKKDLVLEDDDIECTLIERKVLALGCKHPFICHLFCTFQTESHLFFAMEYLNGGDLMFHIQQSSRFDFDRARFYASEVLLALKFLHKKGIVYRDLKLDNVLLDHEGHIRLADFGMCKLQIYLDRMTDTFCGTPDYMAPEIIKGLKYTYCVDWWSFGVLLYEMLMGQSPFNGCDEDELFWSICNEQPFFPKHLSRETKQLLALLLDKDPAKRLGVKGCVSGDICDQPFFKGVNFDQLEKKQVIPPFRPQLRHPMDVSYFESAFTADEPLLTPVEATFLEAVNQTQFKGFSYTNPNYTLS